MKINNKYRLYIIFNLLKLTIVCFYLISCSTGGDYEKELSGNFFYRDEGSKVKEIISHLSNGKNIYSTIVSYDFNKDYIIAVQKPNYEAYKISLAFELRNDLKRYPANSSEEIMQSERVADSLLKHDPFYVKVFSRDINYWIISNKIKQVYGPLSKEEYLKKRTELRVPRKLKLNKY